MDYEKLIKIAKDGLNYSYSPYSGLRVAAALLTSNGKVFSGCNVENASFGATICAERTAIVKAVSEGEREFTAIAVVSDLDGITPCGICLQSLFEFAPQINIIIEKNGEVITKPLSDYLPNAFCMDNP